jgi:cobalt-zinc-cadmium resistance protein CzcA
MINRILEFSLRQRVFVLMATFGLVGVGVWSMLRLPIDAVPDITNVQVQINTEVAAFAPEEIEKLVTFPIETEMAGIQNLDELRSISKFGLSQVTLVFEDGTDIYRARQLVNERLQNTLDELPSSIQPRLAPITTGLGEIYHYVVDYKPGATNKPATRHEQLMQLKLIQDWTIKPMLRSVPGIAEISPSGGYEKQIVVQPDPQKMTSAGIGFDELTAVIGENAENAGGGVIQQAGEQISIRGISRVQTTDEIANLPIKFGFGKEPIKVKDVAEVGIGSKVRTGASLENGEETVSGITLMLAGGNSRLIARSVDERLKEIQKKLPEGVEIRTTYDRSDLVNRTIATVKKNLFEGAVLVVVVLLLLLGNVRAALIVAAAIPLAMLFALTGMVQSGVSGNLMSLGAIDFGLIIDGAVVIVENIVRQLGLKQHQLGRRLNREERLHVVLSASKQVGSPMFFGVAIITIVYIPILALTGIEGKMFHPMAWTVMFALGGALVLTLTLMPALCSFILTGDVKEGDNWAIRVAKLIYAPVLHGARRFRWFTLSGAVGLFALSAVVFSRLGAEFVPQLDEGTFLIQMVRTTSIGLDAAIDMQEKSERVLLSDFPEVARTYSRIGTAEVATDPMGVNVADTYVFFAPQEKWRKINGHTIAKEELANLMSEVISRKVPGQAALFMQPIEMRFNELLEGTRADIAVKVFGPDYDILEKSAKEIRDILANIQGAADVDFDALGKAPALEITLNRTNLGKFNFRAAEVNNAIATGLGGKTVGTVVEGNRRFDIVVRMPEASRTKIEGLKYLPVDGRDGSLVTLGQLADFKMAEQVNTINRESGQRRLAIVLNLRGRDVESFVKEAQDKIQQVKLPEGYYVEFGGQFKNLQQARARLMIVVPVALILIFLLVFAAFGSLRQALLIYSGIPLAVTGGVFALALRGLPFSISAGVGFIALSGVAVLNGLVMISYFNQLREEGKGVQDSVLEGSLTRLRPVLMTALVASFGFVPMALAHGAGAEVQRPLATVVIGGILSSTFLTLVLLPTLYEWVERKQETKQPNER